MKTDTGSNGRILILGCGFAGLYTALNLQKSLPRSRGVEITLVNRENFFLFTPMLHEIAASDLEITSIVSPIRALLPRVNFVCAEVESIALESRTVGVVHSESRHRHELAYDQLVIALGSVTNFFGLPGLQEHAFTFKSLGDAIALRNHLLRCLEDADFECARDLRTRLLTFVVAGGGFSGVEVGGALNDFVREALASYRHLNDSMVRVVLVHAGPVILPELGEELGRFAQSKLSGRHVEVLLETRVNAVSDRGVELTDGRVIEAATLVWTAGTSPHPLLGSLPVQKQGNRIVVDEYLEVPGWPGVWALGDCAVIPDSRTGKPYPPTAQHAVREGRIAAQNVIATLTGGRKARFAFSTLGQLAAIGKRTGVARILGVQFSGFVAWWLWRTIYLAKLPSLRKKLRVAIDWTFDLVFSRDLVQFQTQREAATSIRPGKAGYDQFGAPLSSDGGAVPPPPSDRNTKADRRPFQMI